MIKSCGKKHTSHDWDQDGRCRRCGATWQCPPHWMKIDENGARCRFCSAETTTNHQVKAFDDGTELKRVLIYTGHLKGEKLG